MKCRRIGLLGRIGTVLLAADLALILTSIIPPAIGRTAESSSGGLIASEEYAVLHSPHRSINITLSPWLGCRVLVESEVDMDFYLFDVTCQELIDLIPELNETHLRQGNNVSVLEAFLQSNPEHVLFQGIGAKGEPVVFFPKEVTNVTLVIANSSPREVLFETSLATVTTLVPLERAVVIAGILFCLGAPLTLYWAVQGRRRNIRQSASRSVDFHDSSSELQNMPELRSTLRLNHFSC